MQPDQLAPFPVLPHAFRNLVAMEFSGFLSFLSLPMDDKPVSLDVEMFRLFQFAPFPRAFLPLRFLPFLALPPRVPDDVSDLLVAYGRRGASP